MSFLHRLASHRRFSTATQYSTNVARNNAILAFSLFAFCGATFTYTLYQIKAAGQLGADFDQKLNEAPCQSCEEKKKSKN